MAAGLQTLQSLCERLPAFGERQALGVRDAFGVRWWSYRRLHVEALAIAADLRACGLAPRSRVIVWAPNCPEWVALLMGAALRGVTVVPADEHSSAAYVERLVEQTDARMIFHGPAQDVSGFTQPTVQLGGRAGQGWPALASAAELRVPIAADDPALIMFTSGTTQQPKGVILTHGNVLAQVSQFRGWRWLARLRAFRILVLAPLSHSQGLILGIALPLSLGLSVLYTSTVDPAHLIRTVRDNRVTLLATVPRLLHVLGGALRQMPDRTEGKTLDERLAGRGPDWWGRVVQARHVHRILGRQFRVVLVGGAALPWHDEEFWRRAGCVLVQGYGLTETAAIVSVNLSWAGGTGSIGQPLLNQTIKLAEDGEILVRGPNVSPGYFNEASMAEQRTDGFLRTGDLARLDERKRLYFLGRKKDVIVTGEGFNVYPQDVEAMLSQQPGVRDAVALGLPREGHEEVHAVLLLLPGAEPDAIVRSANAALETHQKVRSWTIWADDDFPRGVLFKVQREEVARVALEARGAPAEVNGAVTVPHSLEEILALPDRARRLRLLASYLVNTPLDQAGPSLSADLGLSSLDIAELLTTIEALRGTSFDDVSVPQDATLAELAQLARAQPSQAAAPTLPVREPAWSRRFFGNALRVLTQPLLIGAWARMSARIVVEYSPFELDTRRRYIIAAAPHRHWLDAFAIYMALPRAVRRRMAVVTNRDFHERFAPTPGISRAERRLVGLAYYLLMPLVFRFAIVPNFGSTRAGLYDMARLLDEGHNVLTFPKGLYLTTADAGRHDPGVALLALQTQLPILPIWLESNDLYRVRPSRTPRQVTVCFGDPIEMEPGATPADVVGRLEHAYEQLR